MGMNVQAIREYMAAPKSDCHVLIAKMEKLELSKTMLCSEFFISFKEVLLKRWNYAVMLENDPELRQQTLESLQQQNLELYADLCPRQGYSHSMSNPDYSTKLYGQELGQLLSVVFSSAYLTQHRYLTRNFMEIKALLNLYFRLLAMAEQGLDAYDEWLQAYREYSSKDREMVIAFNYVQRFSPDEDYFRSIVRSANLSDNRYLYRYGSYISTHDLTMAEYVNSYPEEELQSLAKFIVQSFVDGFVRARKDYRIKKYVNLVIPVGFERLGRMLIVELEDIGLEAMLPKPRNIEINRQYSYDHRFDLALSLDRELVDSSLQAAQNTLEMLKSEIGLNAGPVLVELFGEEPFNPESKSSALKLNMEQQQLFREYSGRSAQIYYQFYKRDEASFSIIAFPSPDIGPKFPEIFAETLKINLLDSNRYAQIQQHIIDVLDSADYVHVKGKPGNDTDIKVKMHPLPDPEHQTLFENCVADVNIPVGEVFTSPLLKGTNGTLHVEDIYLGNLRYLNLKVHFKDGWVEDYSCSNFSDPEEGKKYIHENLLLPHKTLPIGEFAIGTNTTAYQIARKYDIMQLLPILIIEKMGPHFAIGDTCFSHEEDAPHPSFVNGKEMIAVENEKSCTRKENPLDAYLQKHMDITLPYEMLESITAVSAKGDKIDIIRNSRFVVPGTEELNIPLDEGWEAKLTGD